MEAISQKGLFPSLTSMNRDVKRNMHYNVSTSFTVNQLMFDNCGVSIKTKQQLTKQSAACTETNLRSTAGFPLPVLVTAPPGHYLLEYPCKYCTKTRMDVRVIRSSCKVTVAARKS